MSEPDALNQVPDTAFITSRLAWPSSQVDIVLDTDTYNEIDDQFALSYALLSSPRLNLEAVYAAPFENHISRSPEDGMNKSYAEILRIFDVMGLAGSRLVLRGSEQWLNRLDHPVKSEACDDLIDRARHRANDSPLYVVSIGAPTNVASALLAAPDIRKKIVVLWLGGHPLYWHDAREFNLLQNLVASRVLFDSGVPLILFPCKLVAEMVRTTISELETHLRGTSRIGDYLTDIFVEHLKDSPTQAGLSKEIWDLAPLSWLMN
ncbi:MAG: nucleoside hydrolase, partial [Planctomycetota bacterium]